MGKDQYISLIAKKLGNELNSSELRELNTWLSGNSENPELLSDFKHIWSEVSSYKAQESFDSSSAFDKFSKKYDLSPVASAPAPISTPQTGAASTILKYLMIGIVTISLILGAFFLSKKLVPDFSNETMAALPVQLTANVVATLKSNTSLNFDEKTNSISGLEGGAYFDLSEMGDSQTLTFDLAKARILAGQANLNVDNYQGENIIADVESGEVTVMVNDEEVSLKAGQSISISKANGSYTINKENSPNAFAWSKGVLSFDNTPLEEVFTTIDKFYGTTISVVDDSKIEGHFTAMNLKPQSLEECLELLAAWGMEIKQTGADGRVIEISNIKVK